jgi:hypothetical protein
MEASENSDPKVLQEIESLKSAVVALLEHVVASDTALIEVVAMLADRASAEGRLDDVRPMVKALGQTKSKSKASLDAVKKLVVSIDRSSGAGVGNGD